jgi:L-lactate dehydrogenase complex protein LldF
VLILFEDAHWADAKPAMSPRFWPGWPKPRRSGKARRSRRDDRRRRLLAVQGERSRGPGRRAAPGRALLFAQLHGPARSRRIVVDLCRSLGAKTVTKGKSMVSEEIGLNEALAAAGVEAVETDLGEYAIQLRGETPSHIIAPAIHLTKRDIEADFRRAHRDLPPDRDLSEPERLVAEARAVLRAKFFAADVGITGTNFLVAETGTSIIVTNEGNGDLTQMLPSSKEILNGFARI